MTGLSERGIARAAVGPVTTSCGGGELGSLVPTVCPGLLIFCTAAARQHLLVPGTTVLELYWISLLELGRDPVYRPVTGWCTNKQTNKKTAQRPERRGQSLCDATPDAPWACFCLQRGDNDAVIIAHRVACLELLFSVGPREE
eukprot:972816-Prymnesium_polylepis.1